MGLIGSAKGEILKGVLGALTHGDTGSTVLGAVAGAVLVSGVSFSDLFSTDQTKKATAIGLLGGSVIVGVWGYYIGKPKVKPTDTGTIKDDK